MTQPGLCNGEKKLLSDLRLDLRIARKRLLQDLQSIRALALVDQHLRPLNTKRGRPLWIAREAGVGLLRLLARFGKMSQVKLLFYFAIDSIRLRLRSATDTDCSQRRN